MRDKVLRLLVIEDSPSDVRLIKEALKESQIDCELSVASDGVEGLAHLRKVAAGALCRPDLILLDLNLPRKNGREVLSEVKSSPRLKQIPVLVMTSSRSEDDVNEAYTLNANCFISKPYDLQEYIDVVRSIEEFWLHTATLPETDEAVRQAKNCVR